MGIRIEKGEFVDEHGRILNLRGVNLAGSTKIPAVNSMDWLDSKAVSFVDRPFPLDEADEHFVRLRSCGLRFIRFLITWEAIEHEGPGLYDRSYLQYVRKVLEKASQHGMYVYLDPHQDVWSHWTGRGRELHLTNVVCGSEMGH